MTGLAFHSVCLIAAAEGVRHRVTSALVESFSEWWHMPALVVGLLASAAFVLWMYRRDAVELPRGVGWLLAALRLGTLAVLAAAWLDFERTAEHEILFPSRVAVLVDTSASMTLTDATDSDPPAGRSRARRGIDVLDAGGLLEALAPRHEVSVWRFDADAERLVTLPLAARDGAAVPAPDAPGSGTGESAPPWRERLVPQGYETRLGEAIGHVVDQEPGRALAGVIVLSDGANNAGVDPVAAAAALVQAGAPLYPLGIGSSDLPANVRVADVLVPARVFPGDRFPVTAYLQPQGCAGTTVRVELLELAGDAAAAAGRGRSLDAVDAALGADGELVAVRFDVPGLATPGRRTLAVRLVPPPADRTPADDVQTADVEVVERVTQVLLMAGGPSREYQFMRNVLERDKSFAVDVLLGTATEGISQDARTILDAFPPTDEALGGYDAIVAFDYDWRLLDQAAQARLERWVARESGGLMFVAGNVFTDAWLSDPQTTTIRGLVPVDMRRSGLHGNEGTAAAVEPMPLAFTRDGQEAEFLWLAASRIASQTLWSEFPGVYSCVDSGGPKPGATVYARVERPSGTVTADAAPVYLAGQYYGSGSVLFAGSGELWRLRAIDGAIHERLVTQLVRHVSQGRLLRGSQRTRLLLDRDRFPVGASVVVRLAAADGAAGQAGGPARCRAVGPDGVAVNVPLAVEPARPGVWQGAFIASREGAWQIECDPGTGDDGRITRRIQVQLPDRELARPRLDRAVLEQLALATGGAARFLDTAAWTPEDAARLAAAIPDRSRREYEAGVPDARFKRWLNGLLLAAGVGLLCLEWIVRRLVKLA